MTARDHAWGRTDLAWTRTLLGALAIVLVQARSAPGPSVVPILAVTALLACGALARAVWDVPRAALLASCVLAVVAASTLALVTALVADPTGGLR